VSADLVADESAPGEEQVEAEPYPYDLSTLLPEGAVCLGYAVSIKFLDADGDLSIFNTSHEVTPWEALGMLETARDDLKDRLRAYAYAATEEDEED